MVLSVEFQKVAEVAVDLVREREATGITDQTQVAPVEELEELHHREAIPVGEAVMQRQMQV